MKTNALLLFILLVAEALGWLEQAIQKGVLFEEIQDDADLDTLRDLPEFKALMKKYFPEQVKD